MSEAPLDHTRRYGGWQPEKSGFVGRLSAAGFVFTAAAVVLLLVPLYVASPSAFGLTGPVAAVLLVLAYARVGGLAADEWLVLAVRHAANRARRRNLFASGVFAPADPADPESRQPMDLPGPLAALQILAAPTLAGATAAVVHAPYEATYTVVLPISHPGLALAEVDRADRRVSGWGAVLAGLCVEGGPIVRLAVTQRCAPDDGTALAAWTAEHTAPDAPPAALAALAELAGTAGSAASSRQTYLAVSLSAPRARTAIKGAGGGPAGAAAVLLRQVAALLPALAAADLTVGEPLTPRALAEVIRTGYDPHATAALAARRAGGPAGLPAGVAPELAGPAAAVNGWAAYTHDGATSVTYQVRGWPRSEVYASVLAPLLKPAVTARRSFTLLYEPLGPRRAERELSVERTKGLMRRALRAQTGRVESADDELSLAQARAQDRARAAGHGIFRFTALASVTVTDPDGLDAGCAELEADAAAAKVELRRMWGAQDVGFAAAALPLGQGLPARRVAR